jgi:hypothetical protein
MAPVPGRALLTRIIARVHASAQESRSREEFELSSITLRLLALLRQGREATLDLACSEAFGMHFTKWCQKSMERTSALAWEFQQLIPDFDPAEAKHAAMVKASGVRRPEAFSGNLYEMPQEEVAAEPQPLRRVSAKTADRQPKTAS